MSKYSDMVSSIANDADCKAREIQLLEGIKTGTKIVINDRYGRQVNLKDVCESDSVNDIIVSLIIQQIDKKIGSLSEEIRAISFDFKVVEDNVEKKPPYPAKKCVKREHNDEEDEW